MNTYLKLYGWAMRMKLRMSLYIVTLLCCKIFWNWTQGILFVQSLDILTIFGVCLLFAMLESAILPADRDPTLLRTGLWTAAANAIFCGGAYLSGWFQGIPVWGAGVLIALLELSIALMWFGDHVAMRADSARLNRQLKAFQRRQERTECTDEARH